MITTTLRTQPFTCPSCVSKIETSLGRLDGVSKVTVGFNSARVKVEHGDEMSSEVLAQSLKNLGYAVESFSQRESK